MATIHTLSEAPALPPEPRGYDADQRAQERLASIAWRAKHPQPSYRTNAELRALAEGDPRVTRPADREHLVACMIACFGERPAVAERIAVQDFGITEADIPW